MIEQKSEFNGNIDQWDNKNVQDMTTLFRPSTFDGDISNWDVSNVKEADINKAIEDNNWNISKVKDKTTEIREKASSNNTTLDNKPTII